MALLKLLVLVAVIGAVACDHLDSSRRRLAPKEPPATEDPNFQEVKIEPCDVELNNFCGSLPTAPVAKDGEGFYYPG
ncbi:hypothetical protein RR48_12386 [Papilio machaon]|uniref:Uncharacterized protein n=1 Tax=Papilio machaon TaxID=76193 RepID=A0A194QSY7_PAPMA|nr:hypothetical protein RR48_12386 [Papilio machaon]